MGLTYDVIAKAFNGDETAIGQVITHYGDYIDSLINLNSPFSNGGINAANREDLKAELELALYFAIPKFKEQI